MAAVAVGMFRSWWRPLGRRAARAYIAGPDLSDAIGACVAAARRGFASAIGFWNDGEPAPEVVRQYEAALDAVSARQLDGYVSVKAPAFGFSNETLRELLLRGAKYG